MKTLSLKQIRNAALCLATAAFLAGAYGSSNALRAVTPPALHTANVRTLLADDGQETHGGKGHRRAVSHIA